MVLVVLASTGQTLHFELKQSNGKLEQATIRDIKQHLRLNGLRVLAGDSGRDTVWLAGGQCANFRVHPLRRWYAQQHAMLRQCDCVLLSKRGRN